MGNNTIYRNRLQSAFYIKKGAATISIFKIQLF